MFTCVSHNRTSQPVLISSLQLCRVCEKKQTFQWHIIIQAYNALCKRLSISVNWSFVARCYGWGATSEYRLKIGDFAPTGASWPKISRRRGRPTNHSSSQKAKLNDLSYGIIIWTDVSSILSQITRLTDRGTDRQTDGILIARPRLHSMQRGIKQSCLGARKSVDSSLGILVLMRLRWNC